MAGATAPPTTAKTTISLGPLWQQAVAQAKSTLTPQIQTIQGEQAGADATATQQATDAQNAGDAASKLIASLVTPVQGAYTAAAQNQELAGNGFSHGLQDALRGNTDNLNATLAKLNAPVALDSHANEAGDALYSMGGFNPGTTFAKQGAAAAAGLAGTASAASLVGLENAKSVRAQALVADQGFQNKIAEIAAKLPGDAQTNYAKLQTLALDDKKFAEQVKNDDANAAYKAATLKLAQAKYNTSVDEFNAKQTLSYQRLAQSQVNADRNYQVKLANLGIAQKKLQLTVVANAFKAAHGGYTQAQLAKLQAQSTALAQGALNGSTSYVMKNGVKTPVHSGGIPFFEALTQQLRKGIPVQTALGALERIYPASARPTDEALQQYLGPLTPAAVRQQVQVNVGTPGVAGLSMTNPTSLLTTGPKVQAIAQGAAARGLDPQAVLAVASMEGLSGGIGDGGHAFGPFQLNNAGGVITGKFPGATPQQINDWAWSPAGINFALDHMASVARGLTGPAAIDAIVRRFERPLAPNPEVAGAVARYGG